MKPWRGLGPGPRTRLAENHQNLIRLLVSFPQSGVEPIDNKPIKTLVSALMWAFLLYWAAPAAAYDYPIADPFLATVVGTPAPLRAPLPTDVPFKRRSIRVLEREAPDALWYDQELRYSYAAQKGPAPLIFTIAGTGAAHDGSKNWLAARAFYSRGFHVVALGSPVSANFVVAASSSGVPGGAFDDAADLYRVMQKIRDELQGKLEITDYYLAGYSLGAFNAAYVSHLDAEQKAFGFRRVLMMNPPVRLYSSISLLDRMLENIPGGPDNFDDILRKDRRRGRSGLSSLGLGAFRRRTAVQGLRGPAPHRRTAGVADRAGFPHRLGQHGVHRRCDDRLRLHQAQQRAADPQYRSRCLQRSGDASGFHRLFPRLSSIRIGPASSQGFRVAN